MEGTVEHQTESVHQAAGLEPPWTWCARCQRTFIAGSARIVRFTSDALHSFPATLTLCPYFDCGVSTTRHGWRWETIRSAHPDYPHTPKPGAIYVR